VDDEARGHTLEVNPMAPGASDEDIINGGAETAVDGDTIPPARDRHALEREPLDAGEIERVLCRIRPNDTGRPTAIDRDLVVESSLDRDVLIELSDEMKHVPGHRVFERFGKQIALR